jgi:DNA-binding NarL/FixJ family response regulator
MSLSRHHGLAVSAEVGNIPDALKSLQRDPADIVITDLDLDGASGLDLIKSLRNSHPDLPVLVLSMHDESIYAERALRAGARGYVMKTAEPDAVAGAIRSALEGEVVVSEAIKRKILGNLTGNRKASAALEVDRLSDRELQVFRLVGEGLTTRQIAERLSVSVKTVEAHFAHLKRKLGAESGKELQRRAFAWVTGPGAKVAAPD